MDYEGATFEYDPKPETPRPAGVTECYMYVWSGKPGPARFAKCAMLVDGEGGGVIIQTGDLADCQVVAD